MASTRLTDGAPGALETLPRVGPVEPPADQEGGQGAHASAGTEATDGTGVRVPLGQRVVVLGDLLLPAEATPSSLALAADIALTLDHWEGPGLVVVCGDLASRCPLASGAGRLEVTLAAHPELVDAVERFAAAPDRRVILVAPPADAAGHDGAERAERADASRALARHGIETAESLDLRLETAAGARRVVVRAGGPPPGAADLAGAGDVGERPWLAGIDRLEDPLAAKRFVTSRTLYRRLGHYLWVPPIVAVVVAVVLRWALVYRGVSRLVRHGAGRRVLVHAYTASWPHRVLFTLGVIVAIELALAVVVAITSRRSWRAHVGGDLPGAAPARDPAHGAVAGAGDRTADDRRLDDARELLATGATGLVVGGALAAELAHLGAGFFACPGGTTELVREHRGRLGLPPVFLHHRQASWIELETGADLHVRLMLDDVDLPSSTMLERLSTGYRVVKGYKPAADLHPTMVASWPRGSSWPPAPAVAADRLRTRLVRRIAASALLVTALVDLLVAVRPPLHANLALVEQVLPLGVAQAAGALVALAGIGLMMLARGVLRGQRRSWLVSVGLLATTLVLHLARGASVLGLVVTAAVLALLLVERQRFGAASDQGSLRTAAVTLVAGGVAAVAAATLGIEVTHRVGRIALPPFLEVVGAAAERLVGLKTVALPDPADDWVSPAMLAVGITLVVVALFLLTRPVVDRRLSSVRAVTARRAAELRARDIVRRHGSGTLDYFALRDDKQWFFHRDSMVAYAVYGGVCLVSPDPIGPVSERLGVWDAFRRHCDRHGWAVAVMAAAEEWLPIYRGTGMHHVYIGDEAVVDVQRFSLEGGKMKGLRQAVNRVRRYGYRVRFLDPSQVDPDTGAPLLDLMGRKRRGEHERGFSMMLGRLFDRRDTGLLLAVVDGPDGQPAAMCQFVPSPAIRGYSLDLMRRDPGDHPNGLLDFALCSTIEHLRVRGMRGLSLNFAAMRSTLEGDAGDGLAQRVERWALRRMSGVLQIESLWRFNAKYEPSWLPRYIVYDSPEQFAPTVVTILRAESLSEVPVIGRFLTPSANRRTGPPLAGVEDRPTPPKGAEKGERR
ncbi:MAG: bifunctional lysylphosphatidylglycerol flippase/synthetase MprF [Acidimicrobiales bacterium]